MTEYGTAQQRSFVFLRMLCSELFLGAKVEPE